MASAEELRQDIAKAREELRQALQNVNGAWDTSPGGEEWSPQQIAQHVIGGEIYFANFVSKAMLGKPAEADRTEISSAQDALTRHDSVVASADKAYRYVEDRDLDKPAEGVPGTDDQTVRGAMERAAAHLREHAEQIQKIG